jgi:hypothetical protein
LKRIELVAECFVKHISSSLIALSKLRWLPIIESLLGITDSLALDKVIIIALNLFIDRSSVGTRVLNIAEFFSLGNSLRSIALKQLLLLLISSFATSFLEETVAILSGKVN